MQKAFTVDGSIVRFIEDGEKQLDWAEQLNACYPGGTIPDMKERYSSFGGYVSRFPQTEGFISFVLGAGDIIVDLASGPSGYFAPVLEKLRDGQIFIGTDASRAVLNGRAKANEKTDGF